MGWATPVKPARREGACSVINLLDMCNNLDKFEWACWVRPLLSVKWDWQRNCGVAFLRLG
jgi:hypothetical protein